MSFNLEEKLTLDQKKMHRLRVINKNLVEYQLKHRKNVANYRKF